MNRKGLGKGLGVGYKNMVPSDPYIHSLSAKGVKTKCSMKLFAMSKYDTQYDIPQRNALVNKYWNKELEEYVSSNDKWLGGTRHFRLLPLANVKKLVDKKFLELNEQQNESPTTKQFIAFMEKWKDYGVTAHGYVVSKKREDSRVTIEGLEVHNPMAMNDPEFKDAWYQFNNGADELDANRSWWD